MSLFAFATVALSSCLAETSTLDLTTRLADGNIVSDVIPFPGHS
jgi:hypothetical protein